MSDVTDGRMMAALMRFAPLTGAGFAVLTAAAFLLMDKNPEPDASISKITGYWAPHHAHVHTASILLGYAAVLFACFGAAIWSRIRAANWSPLIAGVALLGTAVATVGQLAAATTYFALGDLADRQTTLPATLQTLHVFGSELSFPVAGGIELLLLAVAAAGIGARAFPRSLAYPALVIGALQLTSIGFIAFLLFLVWAVVAGIALAVPARAGGRTHTSATRSQNLHAERSTT